MGATTGKASADGGTVTSTWDSPQALLFQGPLKFGSCLNAHGYHLLITYQPASRYWAFRGIETGIFVLLAAALIAVTAVAVTRRDA